MDLTQQTDCAGEALRLTLQQYKDKPRFLALLYSYVAEIQELENAIWAVWADRELQNALLPFPVAIQISTTGTLGTMAFTYTFNGGAKQGPVLSDVSGVWNIPDSPFFLTFSAINFTSTAWAYGLDQFGTITASGGGATSDLTLDTSNILQLIGKIVGQIATYGANDLGYLNYIQARIAVNRSNGQLLDLITVTQILVNMAAPFAPPFVWVRDYFPASVTVEPRGALPQSVSPYVIAQQFLGAVPGGTATMTVGAVPRTSATYPFAGL